VPQRNPQQSARFATAEELVGAMAGEVSAAKKSAAKRSGCRSTAALMVVIVLGLISVLAMTLQ